MTRTSNSGLSAGIRRAAVAAVGVGAAAFAAGTAHAGVGPPLAAAAGTGGMVWTSTPTIGSIACRSGCDGATSSGAGTLTVRRNSLLRISGRNLGAVTKVVFLGRSGKRSNITKTPRSVTGRRLDVRVAQRAQTGPIQLVTGTGERSKPSKVVLDVVVEDDPGADGTGPATTGPAADATSFIWPLGSKNKISSPFGQRDGRLHAGDDILTPTGTKIKAVANGVVIMASDQGGYGLYTCVRHHFASAVRGSNDWVSCYAHQSRILVKIGQVVTQGEVIGLSGCTGSCYGDHLHFEVRRGTKMWDAQPQDPLLFLP